MAQLWNSLGPWVPGRPRVIQFVAATRGEGVSTIAREFARLACQRVRRPVWLVDTDLAEPGQHVRVAAEAERFGGLGPEKTATPDGSVFFTVQPPLRAPDGRAWPEGRYLAVQQAGGRKLWVTRFRREMLRGGQQATVVASPQYWAALRQHADLVVVDSPSADRANTALTLAPFMDATVLVVAADGGDVGRTHALKEGIIGAGGNCAGLVFNRAQVETPDFIRAILP